MVEKKRLLEKLEDLDHGKLVMAAGKLRAEFRRNVVMAITAGFGLVIALSWNEVIKEGVNLLLKAARISPEQGYGLRIVAAIMITFISVIGILSLSRWAKKKED